MPQLSMGQIPNEGKFGGTEKKRLTKDDGSISTESPRFRLFRSERPNSGRNWLERPEQVGIGSVNSCGLERPEQAGIGSINSCGRILVQILSNLVHSAPNKPNRNGIDNTDFDPNPILFSIYNRMSQSTLS